MVADVVWGGLDVGKIVAGALCGVLGVDGLVVGGAWWLQMPRFLMLNGGVMFMGRLVRVAPVGDVGWGVLDFDGLVSGVLDGEVGAGSQVTEAVWGGVGGDWLVLFLECGGWV